MIAGRRAGMRDVAREAGVSVSTVANVLNNSALVAPATRERVEAALLQVGYVRSGPARQLRGVPSRLVGVVSLDQANPFYAALNRSVEDRLAADGCLLLACSTDLDADREARILRELEEHAVLGVIVTPTGHNTAQLSAMSRRGTPVVLVDSGCGSPDLCAVTFDHVHGGRLIGEHLALLGHRRIAFVTGTVTISPVVDRYNGLRAALAAAGLNPADTLVDVPVSPEGLMDAARAAVAQILAMPDPPTAIVCLNDLAAAGVLRGLAELDVRVPADVSVVGYDDLPFAAQLNPALTTISQPVHRLGSAAASLLLDEHSAGHQHQQLRFEPSLVVRSSTQAVRR